MGLLTICWSLVVGCFWVIPWSEWLWEIDTWSCWIHETLVRMIVTRFIVIIVIIVVFVVIFIIIFLVILVMHIVIFCIIMFAYVSKQMLFVVF